MEDNVLPFFYFAGKNGTLRGFASPLCSLRHLMKCKICNAHCIRKGVRNNAQQYYCKPCSKYQRLHYKRQPVEESQQRLLIRLNNEGLGINSISRILKVSASSIVRHIKAIEARIERVICVERNSTYEIDEMLTYVGRNKPSNYIWIAYAINRKTREVIDFVVGKRTKENLQRLIDTILKLQPESIYTDGLNIYKSLIDKAIHKVQCFKINHIERKNLTLRTHLKRLSRKTICFSRSIEMLRACLMIYFYS